MMTDEQKEAAYYKAGMLKKAPPFVPARVRVLKEQFGDGPFRGAGVSAGEHDCRCNKWGALESRSQAINESDRLRNELATERQAREAQQEQDGVDVKDAAVGYLVRVTKRKPRYVTQPERARDAALAAVRAGAGRAEVLAVVPVGVARRGAEWRGSSNPTMGKGD